MTSNLESFINHLRTCGYDSRSSRHSDALAEAIIQDLYKYCPSIAKKVADGRLVYDLNFTIINGISDEWNVDLVIGEPPFDLEQPPQPHGIQRHRPSTVHIAIEIKSLMTEHHKAAKNRKRDFEAHHIHVHRYNPSAIAGGVLVVNAADTFQSTLRSAPTTHTDPTSLVTHGINQLRTVSAPGRSPEGVGLEARTALVVDCDNIDLQRTALVTRSPAPQIGDPLHYHTFIQTICNLYAVRFP